MRIFKSILFILFLTTTGARAQAPLSAPSTFTSEELELFARGEISSDRRIAGGLLGTIVGFGSGHIVTGMYGDKGLIFTLGEAVALPFVLIGGIIYYENFISCAFTFGFVCEPKDMERSRGLLTTGLVILSIFKVWEIADVWWGPLHHNERYRRLKARESHLGFYWTPALSAREPWRLGFTTRF